MGPVPPDVCVWWAVTRVGQLRSVCSGTTESASFHSVLVRQWLGKTRGAVLAGRPIWNCYLANWLALSVLRGVVDFGREYHLGRSTLTAAMNEILSEALTP